MAEKPLEYRDFNLELTAEGDPGKYQVRVLGQTPGGEMSAAQADEISYDPSILEDLLYKLDVADIDTEQLIDLGERLAALLLPGRVRQLFEASLSGLADGEALRLRLRIEPLELSALPWEFAYLPRIPGGREANDFLALRRTVSITRYATTGAPLPPLKPISGKEKIRLVAALANPRDQQKLNLRADQRAIELAIAALKEKSDGVEAVILKNATRDDLLQRLSGAEIFHFAGHGVFEGVKLDENGELVKKGKILLVDAEGNSDFFESDQLAAILGERGIRLVILGACYSAARDEAGAWSGVAPALTRLNVPAVLAMQYDVEDTNASTFMAYVYTRVLGGYTIDEAVHEGRLAIATNSGFSNRDWGIAALYLRAEDGFLFPIPPPAAAGEKETPLVLVQRELGTVRGEDIGAVINNMVSGRVEVRERVEVVESGGKKVGIQIGTLGGEEQEPDE